MSSEAKALEVQIMGRSYRVACQEGERQALLDAVAYLDKKMREIRDSGKVVGAERIAIQAALNIAHELLSRRAGGFDLKDFQRRIEAMQERIDRALSEQDELF